MAAIESASRRVEAMRRERAVGFMAAMIIPVSGVEKCK
jgi:hypothetical protein